MTTCAAPSSAARWESAEPNPVPAPVTRKVFPSNLRCIPLLLGSGSDDRAPTIDVQDLSVDEARLARGEEEHRADDLVEPAEAARRDQLQERLLFRRIGLQVGVGERRLHVA